MGWGDGAGKRNENGFRDGMKIKIMIFPVKYDKFTGFFDKFLKISDYANDCNKRSYHINLSVPHSDMAQKKVFLETAHLPASACISSRTASRRQSLIQQSALTPAFARHCPPLRTRSGYAPGAQARTPVDRERHPFFGRAARGCGAMRSWNRLPSLEIGGPFLEERGGALDLVLGRHQAGLAEPLGHHAGLGAEF